MSTIIIAVDSSEADRLFASTLRAVRRGLGVSVAQLARASGIARNSIEAIEAGGTTTRAQRHHITVALDSLSRSLPTQALPVDAPRDDDARLPSAAVDETPIRCNVKAPALAGH